MKNLLVLLLLIGHVALSRAEDLSARPVENRFLFVVENSASMNASAKATEKTLRELIESGVQGQMQPGDSFGLWTFNEQLDTSFELQQWIPSEGKKLAETATNFLKKRRYTKKTAMQSVLPPLFSVVKGSRAITVILISTGSQPISGTPFDTEINGIYSRYARELQKAKLPFVTVLLGRKGKLVTHAVNSALGPFQIPKRPIEPDPVVTKVETNAPIAVVIPVVVTNQPPAKRYAKENIIITGSASKIQPTPAAPETNVPIVTNASVIPSAEKTDPQTNPIPAIPPVISETTQAVALIETQKPLATFEDPSTFKPQAQAVGGNPPESNFKRRNNGSFNTAPIVPEVFTNNSTTVSREFPAVVATQPIATRKNFTLIGLALLAIAGILIAFFIRSARGKSQPSFISRSMNERK